VLEDKHVSSSAVITVVSAFLGASVFIALHASTYGSLDSEKQIQQWMTAFLMLSFYLFMATILFCLPSLGFGTWSEGQVRFTNAWRRFTFLFAMVFYGTAFFLHSARIVFSHSDYGMWIAGGIAAAIALFALVSIGTCRLGLLCCMGLADYSLNRNEVSPLPAHVYQEAPNRSTYM
jgi:hypothetical protein